MSKVVEYPAPAVAECDPEEGRAASWTTPYAEGPVAVVGLGYVGLPTALALLAAGNDVIGVDCDPARLAAVRRGDVDLGRTDRERLAVHLAGSRFSLTADPSAVARARTVLICVPTPVDRHLTPDLSALEAACGDAVAHAVPGQSFVLTSTSYVGCTRDLLAGPLRARGLAVGRDVLVSFSPERIDPGNEKHTQERTPRVVGGADARSGAAAAALLERVCGGVHRAPSAEAAEMAKLWENTFRAVNIALANELADGCRRLSLDPAPVVEAAATKPYGFMAFRPGPGVGGHCIPCDPHYLLWQLRALRTRTPLLDAAMSAVAARPGQVVRRCREVLADHGTGVSGARVLLVGVSYKPGVADLRQSPALEILAELAELGAKVHFTDPLVPRVEVGAQVLAGEADPQDHDWDLIVVHTVQPGSDLSWLAGRPAVLDTTYRLGFLPLRETV